MKDSYAVITGASQGLGKAFAEELAKEKNNLILVSLPGQNLKEFAEELESQYCIKVCYHETDLSLRDNVLALTEWINSEFNVDLLINNAGIGGSGKFTDVSGSYIEKIIQLNVLATALLTHQLLPNLQKSPKAYILNVSSLAAFSPMGYKTVYPASKAFVHSFSRGLYQELKDTNVFVSVVNPGPMKTNAEVSRRIEEQGFWARITSLDPHRVARYCIRQLKKRDTVIMVNHFSWLLLRILPIWLKMPVLTSKMKREINVVAT
ncbi:SDR family NAD(P)-dependent oxidoreductase [Elizabethkingia ursingii]|uniref:SDR family NAD(P)-dependent oxidoreductase n=1 Tax=Elizabethkingia ursingii TaxID=1756150 RepID=UPI002012D776|nr:SDR family NAD(P)-dependent oxidoreductase [Elizabethkingia ursingii]MCL1672992.1 SDR family NAD(P)-dependent oxidoreductase [Elizabethkingia ursingii]